MTGDAIDLCVRAFEGIVGELRVIELTDLERRRTVTDFAGALWWSQTKLTGMHVAMTTGAFSGCAAIGRAFSGRSVFP
jgi:hypothetical protein